MHEGCRPEALSVLNTFLSKYRFSDPLVAEIAQIVRGWEIDMDGDAALGAKATFSKIVARAQPHEDSWLILASKSLGIREAVLRDYAARGDNLSLAILIHVTRLQFRHYWKPSWPEVEFSMVLEEASRFNIQNTLPELRHDFCVLWNQIVHSSDRWMAYFILAPICNVYVALHQGTDSALTRLSASTRDRDPILMDPSSYPVCNIPGHIR